MARDPRFVLKPDEPDFSLLPSGLCLSTSVLHTHFQPPNSLTEAFIDSATSPEHLGDPWVLRRPYRSAYGAHLNELDEVGVCVLWYLRPRNMLFCTRQSYLAEAFFVVSLFPSCTVHSLFSPSLAISKAPGSSLFIHFFLFLFLFFRAFVALLTPLA